MRITALLLLLFSVPAQAASVLASWYGKHTHRKTASGETFKPEGLTAASYHYALGTVLRITNVRNHKSVVVRVNDRGPRNRERWIDVSERAAELLGFKQDGLARVTVDVEKP